MSETFWNGNDIGNIDGVAFNFDLVYGKRIFYSSFFGGIYFFIDSYTPFGHYIETLKYLFEIPMKPFNICNYKNKKYFMFPIYSEYEFKLQISKINKNYITCGQRLIEMFHWIVGIKGFVWAFNTNDEFIFTSCGKYKIDFISEYKLKKYITTLEVKKDIFEFFSESSKLENVRMFMVENLMFSWYQLIIQRIYMLS